MKELFEIKDRLVNISLVVASIAGIPTLGASIFRAIVLKIPFYIIIHTSVYLLLLITTLFRKRISYDMRALCIILLLFFLGTIDLLKTGFLSEGFLWLTTGCIMTALYLDFNKLMYALLTAIVIPATIYALFRLDIIQYTIDYNTYAFMPVTISMRIFNIVLIVLIVSLSLRHIHKNLNSTISELIVEKENLEKIKAELETENEMRRSSEQQVMNSEKNFRNIFDKSSDAILIVGADKSILDFNEAFVKMSELSENEIFSLKYDRFIPAEEVQKYEDYHGNLKNFPGRLEFQVEMPNKEKKFFDCTTSIITYNSNEAVLFMIRDYTEKTELEKNNYLKVIEAEEKERSRFSKELHDGLGPLLSTLKIYLEVFFANPNDTEVRDRIESTLAESIKSVKEISNNISPYILENMGLVKAASSFIDKIRYGKKYTIEFESNLNFRLKPEIEISVYRFITEMINNTIKHANASQIIVLLEETQNKLWIRYSDNGIGFNIDDVSLTSKGIGLLNLRSRIEKLGGKIDMVSSPGNGFSITAVITIDQNKQQDEPTAN